MSFSTPQSAGSTVLISSSKTLVGSGATVNVPIFRVTGSVRVLKLYGVVTTAIGVNNTAASFRLNDQTAQIYLTAVGGTALSAAPAGSVIIKTGLVAAAVTLKSAAAGAVLEPTTLETTVASEVILTKKVAANTDIEFAYTTSDTPTTGAIQFFAEFQSLSADGALVAV